LVPRSAEIASLRLIAESSKRCWMLMPRVSARGALAAVTGSVPGGTSSSFSKTPSTGDRGKDPGALVAGDA
jgi:hypothetical protein